MADQARQKAFALSTQAAAPGSSDAVRREFVSHLATLPSYHNYLATQYFSSLAPIYFSQFEDLQDATVDAVLDLCEDEDEAIRILGIQGLGQTAKADPRWVRGNAGVLLQLLECPPEELKVVKATLYKLLQLAPGQVFGVMADDCKGSEEETGASRRNILEYLYKDEDCTLIRRLILDSGGNKEAEDIFRTEFMEVLKTATATESRWILEMLVTLPSVSSKTAKPETTSAYVTALADSVKAGSRAKNTTQLIELFAEFLKRQPSVDLLVALYFFERHGAAVIESLLDNNGKAALEVVKQLQSWSQAMFEQWESGGQSHEEGKAVKRSITPMIRELLEWFEEQKDEAVVKAALSIENILLPIYNLIRYRDRRQDILSAKSEEKLADLAVLVEDTIASTRGAKPIGKAINNVASMASVLGRHSQPYIPITPSWLPTSSSPIRKPVPPTTNGRPNPIPVFPQPTGQRGPNTLRAHLQTPALPRPGFPAHASTFNRFNHQTPPSGPSQPNARFPTSTQANFKSGAPSGPRSYTGNGQTGVIDMTGNERGKEIFIKAPASASSSSTSIHPPSGPSRGRNLPAKPLRHPPSSTPVDDPMEDQNPSPQKLGSAPLSLAARLAKRPYDDSSSGPSNPVAAKMPGGLLASRIGGSGIRADAPESKRSKADIEETKKKLSARMSKSGDGAKEMSILNRSNSSGPVTTERSISSSSLTSGSGSFSILNQSSYPSYHNVNPTPVLRAPISNGRSSAMVYSASSNASTLPVPMSIRGSSAPEPVVEPVKKGRGHDKDKGNDSTDVGRQQAAKPAEAPAPPRERKAFRPGGLFGNAFKQIEKLEPESGALKRASQKNRPLQSATPAGTANGATSQGTSLLGRIGGTGMVS